VGAAASFLTLNALLTLLLGLRCRSLGYHWLAIRLNRQVIGVLMAFGLASMAAGFAQTFADTAIRASLLKQLGSEANGLVQAPLVLAGTLQAIILGSIGSISLATVSGASDIDDTRRTIDRLLNVALPLSTVGLGLFGLLGVPAIIVLYSQQFSSSAALLPWILCAYLVQAATWVIGAPLLASGDRAIWLTLELVWAGARWAISIALLPVYGAIAVGMGMFVAIVVHFVLNLVTIRFRYQLRIGWGHGARLLVDVAIVGFVAAIGANLTTSVPAMATAALIWLAYLAYAARSTPVMARLRSIVPRR
jgi:O-antigen/teichoic acid export membrane protein